MAKNSLIMKSQRTPKFKSRAYSRCKLCGRPRGYLRKFGLPDLLPGARPQGRGPGRDQGELVGGAGR